MVIGEREEETGITRGLSDSGLTMHFSSFLCSLGRVRVWSGGLDLSRTPLKPPKHAHWKVTEGFSSVREGLCMPMQEFCF